uniref:Uncharacterized protein n=1 Tax=Romanomermis culicivorax TaxID=13658 RepID=A0A915LEN7_ROMCU
MQIVRISTDHVINMDDVVIITETLKYFNFEELCIAERISPTFKSCVELALHRSKCVDFGRMFTDSWTKILGKIQAYCSGLRRLKNLYNVMPFMLWKKMNSVPPDTFIFEDFKKNFLILLPSLQKLTCLEIDSIFIEMFGWENALIFVENSHNLRQLSAYISETKSSNHKLRESINKFIFSHSALTKLEICQFRDYWIDLSCRNLTHFSLKSDGRMQSPEYEQLYALLDVNLNLESLDIGYVSHNNVQLIKKLMRLPKLKTLSLDVHHTIRHLEENSDLSHHRIINDLYFVSLQNIQVSCHSFESHAKFVAFLLARSPLLKELSLKPLDGDLAFYRIVFDKFPLYDQIEIFTTCFKPAGKVQSFMYNELSKMVNLKYFVLPCFGFFDLPKVAELRKLKFLHWSAKDSTVLKMIRCRSSLEGIDLFDTQSVSPAAFEFILDQCPNLRFVCVDFLHDDEKMRKLPLKAPKLQYLQLRDRFISRSRRMIDVDNLIYLVENLPNLCQLSIPGLVYESFLQNEPIKRLCRQKRLLVIIDRHHRSRDDLINEWIHLSCKENPST